MRQTWFSPYPRIVRGDPHALEELASLDSDISYLESIITDLKEKRTKTRDLDPSKAAKSAPCQHEPRDLHSNYLTIVENQRRAEAELASLREQRLTLILRADLGYVPEKRGEFFPYPTLEEKAKEFIQRQKDRLIAVSTVAFFGSGITFSTIFSGTRGSIGLMSVSWAAFAVSFSVCVFIQFTNPESLPFAVVAYPGRRVVRAQSIFFAGLASFIGIVLMGIAVATLDLRNENSVNQIDTRINTMWGGIISLLPVVLGFIYGVLNIMYNGVKQGQIRAQRALESL